MAATKTQGASERASKELVKTSLHLPAGLHWRLTSIAAKEGRDRSAFAVELLNKGLSRHPLDKKLRELASEETGEGEGDE